MADTTLEEVKAMSDLRVIDNDRDEIIVTRDGTEIRGWSYANDQERRAKMLCAREFVEGWHAGTEAGLNRDLLYSYRQMLKAVSKIRPDLMNISRATEDEGDRVYFGSTNDADQLKEIAIALDDAEMAHAIKPLPKILELDSWKLVNEAYQLRERIFELESLLEQREREHKDEVKNAVSEMRERCARAAETTPVYGMTEIVPLRNAAGIIRALPDGDTNG